MEKVDSVLEERNEVYGDYSGGCQFRVTIMKVIRRRYKEVNNRDMSLIEEHILFDIVNKLSRLAVSPFHKDSWMDFQGYAKLIHNSIDDLERIKNAT